MIKGDFKVDDEVPLQVSIGSQVVGSIAANVVGCLGYDDKYIVLSICNHDCCNFDFIWEVVIALYHGFIDSATLQHYLIAIGDAMQYLLLRVYFAILHISIVANFRMIVVLSEWLFVQTMSHLHVWIDSWHMLRQMLSVRSLPQSSMASTLGASSLFGQTVHCSLCDWDCKSCEFFWQIISWYDYVARSGAVSRSGAQPIVF